MPKTRKELQQLVDELSLSMPGMLRTWPSEEDFWPAFAEAADVIQDGATASDYDWVEQQLDEILRQHGRADLDRSGSV